MSPEDRELLQKSVSLAEDNNKILHSMKRSMRYASIVRAIYWIFIIGSALGAYYFIQPYVDEVMSFYNGARENISNFNNTIKGIKR